MRVLTYTQYSAAMILERIVGRDVTRPIGAKEFHDVHYLRQMLYCVFKNLHQSQRKLAFHHADLRLANIMELLPEKKGSSNASTPKASATPKSFRVQDASHHDTQFVSGVLPPEQLSAVDLQGVNGQQQPFQQQQLQQQQFQQQHLPQQQLQEQQQAGFAQPSEMQTTVAEEQANDSVLMHHSSSRHKLAGDGATERFKVKLLPFIVLA